MPQGVGVQVPPSAHKKPLRRLFRLRILPVKPILRINLDTVGPDLPVQMRSIDSPCGADLADLLTGSNLVANIDQDGFLVPVTGKNTPAVIDNGRIPTHGQLTCEDHCAGSRSVDRKRADFTADTVIQSGMEVRIIAAIIGTTVTKPGFNTVRLGHRQGE